MKELTIKLIGKRGSGKTTMARFLKEVFSQTDAIINVNDIDVNKEKKMHHLGHCVESLFTHEGITINIVTENISR